MCVIFVIDTVNKNEFVPSIEERLRVEALITIIMNFKGDDIEGYYDMVSKIDGRGLYSYTPNS